MAMKHFVKERESGLSPRSAERQTPLILVVDDDVTMVTLLNLLLRSAGFETASAGNLAGAHELVQTRKISLILLDVNLPDGNGFDFCRQVVAANDIPVLFISASDDVGTKLQGFAAGGVDYITKPLTGAEVIARVRTHLRLRAANEALSELHEERISRLVTSQQSLMPLPGDLDEAGFQVHMRQALRAGGDFYDVISIATGIIDYIVADASGHDLGVTLWTASFKTLLAEYASILYSPQDICRMLNKSLRRILPPDSYFTAIYARLNRAGNRLTLVNAGHPSVIIVEAGNGEARLLYQEGDLVGIFSDASFGVMEIPVSKGDLIFMYSDGLVEADGSREEGIARLVEACRAHAKVPPSDMVSSIITSMLVPEEPEDDVVLMMVEV